MDDQAVEIMERQRDRFKEVFGRDPNGDDPIFFDPDITDKPTRMDPEKFRHQISEAATKAGMRPEIIYAMDKTGMVLVKGYNEHLFTDGDIKEFQDAVQEYFDTQENQN